MKPDFMDAIRKRREYLIWQEQVEAEEKRINFLKQMKHETMQCNIIAQRIRLQEYLMEREPTINKEIDDWLADEDQIKTLNRDMVEDMISKWLEEFRILQPSEFF